MSITSALRAKLKWYERSDKLTEDDNRVARLAFEARPQEYVDMGYVALYKGKYHWVVVNKKLPGCSSIATPTRSCSKCCKQLEKFVLGCLFRAYNLKQPLKDLQPYDLSIFDWSQSYMCEVLSNHTFEEGFQYGVAYALRRLGIKELPPDWAAFVSRDQSGRVVYHEEQPTPVPAYGRHESSEQSSQQKSGSSFHWFYSVKRIR